MAYLLIVGAGLRIALRTERTFEKLLAVGLTTILGVQAFIIIGGVDQAGAADRHHAAVRQLRRLVAGRQLRPAGAADPPQRLGRPPPRELPDDADAGASAAAGGAPAIRRGAQRPARRVAGARHEPADPPARRRLDGAATSCCSWRSTTGRSGASRSSTRSSATPRAIRREFDTPRGAIVTADGVVVARSVPTPDGSEFKYQREYPTGDLFANVTGYYTFAFGVDAAREDAERRAHRATRPSSSSRDLERHPQRRRRQPGTVQLTLRADLQQVAKYAARRPRGLGRDDRPATGAVLAMYSYPTLRPEPDRRSRLRGRHARRSRTSRRVPATRCSPTPTRSATCPARRSRW